MSLRCGGVFYFLVRRTNHGVSRVEKWIEIGVLQKFMNWPMYVVWTVQQPRLREYFARDMSRENCVSVIIDSLTVAQLLI